VLIWDPLGRILVHCGTDAARKNVLRHWWAIQAKDLE
jgi:hypothetical protein